MFPDALDCRPPPTLSLLRLPAAPEEDLSNGSRSRRLDDRRSHRDPNSPANSPSVPPPQTNPGGQSLAFSQRHPLPNTTPPPRASQRTAAVSQDQLGLNILQTFANNPSTRIPPSQCPLLFSCTSAPPTSTLSNRYSDLRWCHHPQPLGSYWFLFLIPGLAVRGQRVL